MLYVGIDVVKHKHDLAVIDTKGAIFIRHLQIKNNREGFTKLQMTLANLQKSTGEDIQIALEDNDHYCFNILRFLRTQGYPTYSYNPYLIKEYAKNQSLQKTKTDKKDTMTIARKIRTDLDKQSFSANPSIIELKYLTRHTARLKEDCTRKKVSYTRILDILSPELTPSLGSSSAKHQSYVYAILKEYPSAKKLGNAHLTKLTNLISAHSKGRFGKEQAVKLKALAQASIDQESAVLEFELLQTIDAIQYLTTMRDKAKKEVARLMSEIDSPILMIPGIGYKLGSVILAEIRDIKNFRSPNQLLAYAGVEPSVSTFGMNQTET
ncbi:IS110 family transposase [Marinilactibacillus psychrotolerans]|uniref:IS110 family transposase n=1 Tax=Marinilactibacillus psychrotolerans TaxID=191770 RepID=UPI00201E562A|nr:IS110 family transposase [Marinilactibacillus psychrotolerans]